MLRQIQSQLICNHREKKGVVDSREALDQAVFLGDLATSVGRLLLGSGLVSVIQRFVSARRRGVCYSRGNLRIRGVIVKGNL